MKKAIIIIIALGAIFFVINRVMQRPPEKATTAQATGISNTAFQLKVEQNKAIQKTTVTDQGYLYITVANDGADKTPMATAYAKQATLSRALGIKAVKVVDAAGNELGKAFCE